MKVGPSPGGYILEIIRYNGHTYEQHWEEGEFEIDDLYLNSNGEVRCDVESMLRVWNRSTISPSVDRNDEDFMEENETVMYYVVGGYQVIDREN